MFIGRDRLGDNLFGNTLLALDANTGKRIWHFQTVKHDIWDRDLPSPPSLITVRRDGKNVDAVAITTKTGHVFVFDRTNGTPLFPIEYKKYPASTIPGEVASETQPLPTKPAPFARQLLTADMVTTRTPQAHAAALAQFKKMISNGQFVPPSVGIDTVSFPGMDGGAEWGGSAFDPDTGLLYVNSNEMVWLYALAENPKPGTAVSGKDLYNRECASCHRDDRTGAPPAIPSLVDIAKQMSVAEVRSVVFYGSGRMPGFPTLAPDYTNAIVSYVRDGVESTVPIPADGEACAVGHAVPIHGTPQVPRYRRVSGDHPTMGNAECHQHEHGRVRLEDSAWGVSGAGGQGHEGHGKRELRRTDRDGWRSRLHRGDELRQEVPRVRQEDRQARLGNDASVHGKRDAGNLRDQRASVHRHRHERCRESAGPAQHATAAARREVHRVCAPERATK